MAVILVGASLAATDPPNPAPQLHKVRVQTTKKKNFKKKTTTAKEKCEEFTFM